jgi:BMFP domain-containing protein YqiC
VATIDDALERIDNLIKLAKDIRKRLAALEQRVTKLEGK